MPEEPKVIVTVTYGDHKMVWSSDDYDVSVNQEAFFAHVHGPPWEGGPVQHKRIGSRLKIVVKEGEQVSRDEHAW